MALLFCDSFDHYTTVSQKYEGNASVTIGAYGRFSTNGLRASPSNGYARKTIGVNMATVIAGVAWSKSSGGDVVGVFQFLDNTSAQVSLTVNPTTGILTVHTGGSGGTSLGSSSTGLLVDGTVYYIEMKATIHDTTGSVEVRVNGNTVINLSNVNTRGGTSNAYANQVSLGPGTGSGGQTVYYDDFYVCDTSGSYNNDFLGDVRITALFADGDGDQTDFTPTGAASNYQAVDEAAPDDDTSYNSAATAGNKDLLTMGALSSTSGGVKAVQTMLYAKKDDAGSRTIKSKVKSGTTEGDGASVALGTSYVYIRDVFETNPDTTSPWTPSEVNGMQAGYEVVS